MKTAVLSDIHGNYFALQAVIDDAEAKGANEFWCLGDIVGYGPYIYQVWKLLSSLDIPPSAWLTGNHEWGLLERIRRDDFQIGNLTGFVGHFSRLAWPILELQRKGMQKNGAMWQHLESLPLMGSPRGGVYLAHGVFHVDPVRSVTQYDSRPSLTADTLNALQEQTWETVVYAPNGGHSPYLFFSGHTHIPGIWEGKMTEHGLRWEKVVLESATHIDFDTALLETNDQNPTLQFKYVNPGSVGFPRDGNGCASYALIDWEIGKVELRRVPYEQDQLIETMESISAYRTLLKENYVPKCIVPEREI